LCDFCTAVIDKLKYRQSTEGADFEKNMLDECWKYNGTSGDDGNVCELVNKVNLDRLSKDKTLKICIDEKMCATKAKEIKAGKEEDQEEGEARRKQEEEEEKKYEEIENIKSEVPKRD
uniref:Saposin B-type domain-containing protein n=1 Tax=Heligmosomoides polygyrus TaxID=6339 RepID=A0A183GV74_HELPZ